MRMHTFRALFFVANGVRADWVAIQAKSNTGSWTGWWREGRRKDGPRSDDHGSSQTCTHHTIFLFSTCAFDQHLSVVRESARLSLLILVNLPYTMFLQTPFSYLWAASTPRVYHGSTRVGPGQTRGYFDHRELDPYPRGCLVDGYGSTCGYPRVTRAKVGGNEFSFAASSWCTKGRGGYPTPSPTA
jgi:hypothetical protein